MILSCLRFHQPSARFIFFKNYCTKMFSFVVALTQITNHNFKIGSYLQKCFDIVHLFSLGNNKGLWYHFEGGCLTDRVCLFEVMWAAFRKCYILFHDCVHSLPLLPGKPCKQRRHGFRPCFHGQWKCFDWEQRKK